MPQATVQRILSRRSICRLGALAQVLGMSATNDSAAAWPDGLQSAFQQDSH